MRKISILALSILFINIKAGCQITKTNWLIGGNATFVANNTTYEGLNTTGKLINFIIKPNIGYFLRIDLLLD